MKVIMPLSFPSLSVIVSTFSVIPCLFLLQIDLSYLLGLHSHSTSSGKPALIFVSPFSAPSHLLCLLLLCVLSVVPQVGSCSPVRLGSPRTGTVLSLFPASPTAWSSTRLATSRHSGNTRWCPVAQTGDHSLDPSWAESDDASGWWEQSVYHSGRC